jgi:hypothetical protein
MRLIEEKIIPYKGLESFQFGDKLESVRALLKEQHIPFNQSMGQKEYSHPELKRETIKIFDCIELYFLDGILYFIGLENDFKGRLPNGICLGMNMNEVKLADEELQYDEDEEVFVSPQGYSLAEGIDTNMVSYIEVYVPEVENDDTYFEYNWLKKYR